MKTEQEILEKWKPVIEFTSKLVKAIPEDEKLSMAVLLQEYDTKYTKLDDNGFVDNMEFMKFIIPMVRRAVGHLNILEDIEIERRKCMVVSNGSLYDYVGVVAIPYDARREYAHWEDVYIKDDSDKWEKFYQR
jgi:hypothetical protein